MLNSETIKKLEQRVKEGIEASNKLKEYNSFVETKEKLEYVKSKCINCKSINVEVETGSNVYFNVELPAYALSKLHDILENEIARIDDIIDMF